MHTHALFFFFLGLFATAATALHTRQHIVESFSDGIGDDGLYYQWYTSPWLGSYSPINANFTNSTNGSFAIDWDARTGYIRGGKGWSHGSRRNVTYTGTFNSHGNSLLGVYGRSENPPAEYYIAESYSGSNPAAGTVFRGTFTANGSQYRIYEYTLTPELRPASGMPVAGVVKQYWSVRNNKRSEGTVDTKVHFEAWEALGMEVEEKTGFMVVAVESYLGEGRAEVAVEP